MYDWAVALDIEHAKEVMGGLIEPSEDEKRELFKMIMGKCHDAGLLISYMYPEVCVEDFWINTLTGDFTGVETEASDKLRDILRHYGIRIYTSRPFG